MQVFTKLATAGAIATAGLGLAAAGASAYSWSGGAYVATATSAHTFTVAGAFTITCPAMSATFAGTATGSATTSFTPSYGPGCTYFGLPATVTQVGPWEITLVGGPVGGVYSGDLHIPAGTSTTFSVPSIGCSRTISGPQTFASATVLRNTTPANVQLSANIAGMAFTASGCPYGNGTSGVLNTNGNVDIPGVAIS